MGPPEGKGKGQDLARAVLTGLGLKLPVSRTHRRVRRAVCILERALQLPGGEWSTGANGKRCEGHGWAGEVMQTLAGDKDAEHRIAEAVTDGRWERLSRKTGQLMRITVQWARLSGKTV